MKRLIALTLIVILILTGASCSTVKTGGVNSAKPSASSGSLAAPSPSSSAATTSASASAISPPASPSVIPVSSVSASPASSQAAGTAVSPSVPPPPPAAASPSPDKDTIRLEGAIGDRPVHMSLRIKDGKVTGSYYYDKVKQELRLEGTIEINRMLVMKEYDTSGVTTGTFDGYYVPGIRLSGGWTNAKTNTTLDFNLKIIDGIPKDAVWSGEWHRMDTGRFNSATLVIFNETKTSFDFQLDAFSSANMGFIDGTATDAGETFKYHDSKSGSEIMFIPQGGFLWVTANDAADMQAGAGVTFSGKYTKGDLPADTLLSQGYVSTPAQDDAFKAMVGEDYELFLNTASNRSEAQDLDDLGAVVYTWFVHGFGDYYSSVVMFLPDGKLCAAVVDNDNTVIKVYTNSPAITAVPKTVKDWAAGFPKLPVEFHGAH